MSLSLFFAIPAALVLAEALPRAPLANGLFWAIAALVVSWAAPLYAWRAAQRGNSAMNRHELRHQAIWILSAGAALLFAQWPRWIRQNLGLDGAVLIDELAILAPMLLSWVGSCLAVAWTRDRVSPRLTVLVRVLRRSMPDLALPVVPVLLATTSQDLVRQLSAEAQSQAWGVVGCLALGAGMLIGLPLLLRAVWGAYPLPAGPLRARLVETARREGLRVREILVWPAGGRAINAAIAGALPLCRYMFLTDGLLSRLTPDEIEAVLLHETAHVRRLHLPVRLTAVAAPAALFLLVKSLQPAAVAAVSAWLVSRGISDPVQSNVLWPTLFLLYAALALAWCSRHMEHDADLWACRALARMRGSVSVRELAVVEDVSGSLPWDCYLSALYKMHESGVGAGPLHPNVHERIDFLQRRLMPITSLAPAAA